MNPESITIQELAILATADPKDPNTLGRIMDQRETNRVNADLNESARRAGLNLRF